jgi:uncharacterized membrane protein
MAPLIALILGTASARAVGWLWVPFFDSWSAAVAFGLAVMLLLTASAHFTEPRRAGLIATVPPRFPLPGAIVTITGVLEVLGAVGLLVPVTRFPAAICVGVLLIAMYPANVYAAGARRSPSSPTTPIVPRTLIQVVFVGACVAVAVGTWT